MDFLTNSKDNNISISEFEFSLKEQYDISLDYCLKELYSFHLFEFFNILNVMINTDMLSTVNEFFSKICDDEIDFFFNIPLMYSHNVFLVRTYFSFLLGYRGAIKNSEVSFVGF